MATKATHAKRTKAPPLTVDSVLSAVQGVWSWWVGYGVAYYLVGPEKRDELEGKHEHDEDGGARAVVQSWLKTDAHPSWRKLITALDGAEETSVADALLPFAEPLRDPTLTEEKVYRVMGEVRNWRRVGYYLGVPESRWDQIKDTHSTEEAKKRALVRYYLQTVHDASWERLAGELYYRQQDSALAVVKELFHSSQDPTLTSDNLMAVLKGKEGDQTDVQRMQASLDHWRRTHPAPSWKLLARALRGVGEEALAEEVARRYVRATVRSKEIFDAAMKDGYILSCNRKVVLIGAAGSGKSHTLAMIMDEPPPSQRSSTPLAMRPVRVLLVEKTGNGWKVVDKTDLSQLITNVAMSRSTQTTADEQSTSFPSSEPAQTESHSTTRSLLDRIRHLFSSRTSKRATSPSGTAEKVDTNAHTTTTEESSPNERPSIGDELALQIESASVYDSSGEVPEVELIYVIDSGGQPQFHELLSIFLRGSSIFLYVHSLNQALSAYPMVGYYKQGIPIGELFRSAFSNRQILWHCLQAMQSQASQSPDEEYPQLAFVGTHRDLESECSETREEKNEELRSMLPPAARDSVQSYGGSDSELIFPLNAKNPGPEDRAVVTELRKVIENCPAKKKPIPLQWYGLDLAIHRLMEIFGRGVISTGECRVEAERLHFEDEPFYEALKYLHKLSNIFYLEYLPRVIFGNPQIPLDKLTELLELLYSLQGNRAAGKAVAGELRKFRDQGIVTEELLQRFDTHYVDGLFEPPNLLVLFKALLIVAEIGNGEYLMPCLLPVDRESKDFPATSTPHEHGSPPVPPPEYSSTPTQSELQHPLRSIPQVVSQAVRTREKGSPDDPTPKLQSSSLASGASRSSSAKATIPPLLFYFPDGPLLGQFCTLTAYLLSEAKWELLRDKGELVQVTRNSIAFEVPDVPGSVTLSDPFSTYFQVSIDVPAQFASMVCRDVCPQIRDTILKGLRKASKTLNYDCSDPLDAFLCPGLDGSGCESPPHPATVVVSESYQLLKCTRKPKTVCCELTNGQRMWLDLTGTTDCGPDPIPQPPPGNVTPADGVLTEDHLPRLMTVLGEAANYSFNLGIQLGLKYRAVKTLEDEAGPHNLSRFLTTVLSKWLQRRHPPPTIEELVTVISRRPLNDEDLAQKLMQEFVCT